MKSWKPICIYLRALLLFVASPLAMAQSVNPNCTLIVPSAPLTAQGLATPYQLVATDPTAGACHEADSDQSAFVQAAVFDPATNTISIYNPLVVDQNTQPAIPPVVPALPSNGIVALWFGFNGDTLTLQASGNVLAQNNCVNGTPGSIFGQFAYCNAHAFFHAAGLAIHAGRLTIPPLGIANDGLPCPSVRDFSIVDQDQSDNLPTSYLITNSGLAQNTAANLAAFPGAAVLGNPSDNGLLDNVVDVALGCTPWTAPDIANGGQNTPALPLNELQARAYQAAPVALIPEGDPMVLNNGVADLGKVNAYRRGVAQLKAHDRAHTDTTRYCRELYRIAPERMLRDQTLFTVTASPKPDVANSLFTFLAQRFVTSYDTLGCSALLNKPDPVTVVTDSQGVAVSATIAPGCQQRMAATKAQDAAADTPEPAGVLP
jgi:hypothetical protein